ncbi:flagellar motor protein MotS [Bacillus spongiae]|uniref:Flagellar motor protein MotS n=1 Tax=Bacillus spongiae TaxID=2683610 RepID=A0ABU8HHI4_9BACI
MKLNRKPLKQQKGAPRWMVTFSDLTTLILVFFILLFSMSQIDIVKFKAIADSFKQKQILEFYPSVIPLENPSASPDVHKKDEMLDPGENQKVEDGVNSLNELLSEINEFVDDQNLSEVAVATRTERGVVLVLQEQILFNSGDDTLRKEAYPLLHKVGDLLTKIPNGVKVVGHTDSRPINTYKYPSNWVLSGARAGSVIEFLVVNENLDPSRFALEGYGETRPIAPNDSQDNLQKNRRVELVILDPETN